MWEFLSQNRLMCGRASRARFLTGVHPSGFSVVYSGAAFCKCLSVFSVWTWCEFSVWKRKSSSCSGQKIGCLFATWTPDFLEAVGKQILWNTTPPILVENGQTVQNLQPGGNISQLCGHSNLICNQDEKRALLSEAIRYQSIRQSNKRKMTSGKIQMINKIFKTWFFLTLQRWINERISQNHEIPKALNLLLLSMHGRKVAFTQRYPLKCN